MNTLAATSSINIAPLLYSVVAIGFLFFFMVARPQKRNMARHKAMVEALVPGDEIITSGGIYGKIISIDSETIQLEVYKDMQLQVATRAIAMKKVNPPENDQIQDNEQNSESQDS